MLGKIYHKIAYYYSNNDFYHKAIEKWQEIIDLNPNSGEAYFRYGMSCIRLEQIDLALMHLRKALSLGYDDAQELLDEFSKYGIE